MLWIVALLIMRSMSSSHQILDRTLGAADGPSLKSHQAAHAVLFTNELLCDIIVRLRIRDVVSATGICKFWREALKNNRRIQEALFLKPKEVSQVICENELINDLEHSIEISDCLVIGTFHPCFLNFFSGIPRTINGLRSSGVLSQLIRPGREVFISQPPCKTVTVTRSSRRPRSCAEAPIKRATGVTFGDLYDWFRAGFPDDEQPVIAWITVPGYTKSNVPCERFTSRCEVRAGEICRPTGLPLRVEPSDSDCSDDSYGES